MHILTTAVTALRFISCSRTEATTAHNYLFAGIGNHIHIYTEADRETPIIQKPILSPDVHIHGFSDLSADSCVAIHASRLVAILQLVFDEHTCLLRDALLVHQHQFDDWVWSVSWLPKPSSLLAVAGGHSKTWLCNPCQLSTSICIEADEAELTWCATVFQSQNRLSLRAASGSSFGDILMYNLTSLNTLQPPVHPTVDPAARPTHRLKGHDGSVMRIVVSQDAQRMATASVDRSVRVWKTGAQTCRACAPHHCFVPALTHYGHAARVWDVAFVSPCDLTVASVAEDRTCRIWSSRQDSLQLVLHRAHAGRNVWSLAVSDPGDHFVTLATGGEDGSIKTRLFRTANLVGNGTASDHNNTTVRTKVFNLPDKLPNPRKSGGANDEGGRTILLLAHDALLVTTDFGRIMLAKWQYSKTTDSTSLELKKTSLDSDQHLVSWTQLLRDRNSTAFTPSSLVRVNGVVCAGQTNGEMTIVPTRWDQENGTLVTTGVPKCVKALAEEGGMVMGVFGEERSGSNSSDVCVASSSGNLYHWHLRLDNAKGGGVENEVLFEFVAKYEAFRSTKTTIVTAVKFMSERGVIVVGDKGGRIHVFRTPNGAKGNLGESQRAEAWLKAHDDRVSSISSVDESHVLTSGFNGRLKRLRIDKEAENDNGDVAQECIGVDVERSERSAERVNTIVRVFSSGEGKRTMIAGFRGAVLTVWDVQRRAELFRHDVGNWRRAHDVLLSEGNDVTVAFWRSGRLCIAQSGDVLAGVEGGTQNGVGCGGCEFHGGRANDVAWIGGDEVMTCGEDTNVRVMRIDERNRRFEWVQRLGGHISGVNGICVSEDGKVAASCGGSDEVYIWYRDREGSWREMYWTRIGKVFGGVGIEDGSNVVMRVTGIAGGWRGCEACVCCNKKCVSWVVGRSDGLVGLLHVVQDGVNNGKWSVDGKQYGVHEDGAALSVCGDGDENIVVSGGSGGTIVVWSSKTGGVEQRWDGAHNGGVNCMAIRRVDDDVVVVSGGDDETVRVWTVGRDDGWTCEVGHSAAVTGIAFVDGYKSVFVSVGADQRVMFWQLGPRRSLSGNDGRCAALVLTAVCAVADVGGVCAWVVKANDDPIADPVNGGGNGGNEVSARRAVRAIVCGCGLEVVDGWV